MDLQNVLVESEEVFLLRGEGHCGERLLWVVEKIDGGKETFFLRSSAGISFPIDTSKTMELSEIQSKLSLTNKLERRNALQQIFRQIENNTFSQEISQSEEFWKCLKTELSDEYDSCREYTSYIIGMFHFPIGFGRNFLERIYKSIEDDEINHAFCTFFIGEFFEYFSSITSFL